MTSMRAAAPSSTPLSTDHARPVAVETFTPDGRLLWRCAPTGRDALDHPSLGLSPLNGDTPFGEDRRDRMIVVDARTGRVVGQYGHTNHPGRRPGHLHTPGGFGLAPPHSLIDRFPGGVALR